MTEMNRHPRFALRLLALGLMLSVAAACAPREIDAPAPVQQFVEGYGPIFDDGYDLPGVPDQYLAEPNRRALVSYSGDQKAGVVEIDPYAKFLFLINDDGSAWRYPIAVGREGKALRGSTVIRRKAHWPGWTPTANMLRVEPEVYGPFARGIPGGLRSPLGARALYLYRGDKDSHFRIHGTNDLGSIGNSGSAGCIRLFNHDIIDLYEKIPLGTRVVIRTYEDSVRIEGEAVANRGIELEAYTLDPELVYGDEAVAADRPPVIDPDEV